MRAPLRSSCVALSTLALLLAASPAHTGDCGTWSIADAAAVGAGMRSAWDPVNARVLRVGGGSQIQPPELWQWTNTAGWSQVTTTGLTISGRTYAGFVFDSQRNRMLLIGGTRWDGTAENDVWALSLTGTPTWSSVAFDGSPPARKDFSLIYDPVRDRVIRFSGSSGGPPVSDTWQLSLSGTPTWTQMPTNGGPSGRVGSVAVYDPVRDRMIVHGGAAGPVFTIMGDTWALPLSGTPTWTQISASGGPTAYRAEGTYDPLRDRMAVLGGLGGGGAGALDQTSFLSLKTSPFWSPLPAGAVSLGRRIGLAAAYDPVDDLILACGAGTGAGEVGDTRRLDCAGGWWLQTAASSGSVQVIPSKVCYTPGEQVTLVASPANGNMFDHWLGDASGNANPLGETMNASKTIYAQMAPRTTDVEERPLAFALRVSPNPSAGPVTIEYALPGEARVRLSVFDVGGRELARLVDGMRPGGRHVASWRSARSGIYLVRYRTPAGTSTRRLALLQ